MDFAVIILIFREKKSPTLKVIIQKIIDLLITRKTDHFCLG